MLQTPSRFETSDNESSSYKRSNKHSHKRSHTNTSILEHNTQQHYDAGRESGKLLGRMLGEDQVTARYSTLRMSSSRMVLSWEDMSDAARKSLYLTNNNKSNKNTQDAAERCVRGSMPASPTAPQRALQELENWWTKTKMEGSVCT